MKISIQMYTLRQFMKTPEELEETLRRVAEMGYRSVQITAPAFTNPRALAGQLQRHGLSADSLFATVMTIPEKIEEIAENAAALGTDTVRTDSIPVSLRGSADGYRTFAAHLERCGRLLREHGLHFMYHFHSFEFVHFDDRTRGIDILLNNTAPENVWFQPDVFWLTAAGTEPSESLRLFAGRARYMHLKDYRIVQGKTAVLEETARASAPVGTGNLHWHKILATAREIGIENFVVEDDMGILDPFFSAGQSITNLQALLKEIQCV